jgi:hypothetical protein
MFPSVRQNLIVLELQVHLPVFLKRKPPDTTLHVVCNPVNQPVNIDGREHPRARVSRLL